ncbi:hypothetical protein [Pedosphaera parvula]|uniref:Uncharacterized protein n=1 Tax=Pedosphaera parvula (strain Ellin514) TaxID=320771 RepID=B9XF93_PEDPL|nr:hypothetical protein [Pedosphaera parvula]EEF61591.1 hypothetical protein Cflav_PD4270 [Pedosphaera parvula Ellin514]
MLRPRRLAAAKISNRSTLQNFKTGSKEGFEALPRYLAKDLLTTSLVVRKTHSLIIEGFRRGCHGLRRFHLILSAGLRFSGRETLRVAAVAIFLMAFGLSTFLISARGDDMPFITGIVRTNPPICLISYTNCNDTNFDYLVQSSTNLVDWAGSPAVQGATTNTTAVCSVVEPGNQYFHRVVKVPHTNGFLFALIEATNNIHMNGSNVIVDSYSPGGTNYYTGTNTFPTNLFGGNTNIWHYP